MKILKLYLKFKNDFHTSGGSKGNVIEFLKDKKGTYIPATHVKGVMRTEAERIYKSVKGISCNITKMEFCNEVKNGKPKCEICLVFGAPNEHGGEGYSEGKIRITELRTSSRYSVSRTHVSIDRSTQAKSGSGLFSVISVPHETEFIGYIIVKEDLNNEEDKLLKASIHSMAHYGLGKDRSRGLGGIDEIKLTEVSYDEFVGGK